MDTELDITFMAEAISLARKGLGRTSPNPCVGAVIVSGGRVVGRGYHKKAGTPHAEIHAIADAGGRAKGATMYVTLEPCNHTGKTPPCSHAVVEAGLARVVIGMLDPNPLVDGSGRDYLKQHGVNVETGLLESECQDLNEPFIKVITSGLPLIVMKAGISLDGRLNYQRGLSGWITGAETKKVVHQLRDQHDAIMVGRQTIAIDNPSLTTRLVNGSGRDPARIVLDTRLQLPEDAKIFQSHSSAPTYLFCGQSAFDMRAKVYERDGVIVLPVPEDDSGLDLYQVAKKLPDLSISSVLVEGGGTLHSGLLARQLIDKVCLFYGPLFAGSHGVSLTEGLQIESREKAIRLNNIKYRQLGDDFLVEGEVVYPLD